MNLKRTVLSALILIVGSLSLGYRAQTAPALPSQSSGISIRKTANPGSVSEPGGTVTFTVQVANDTTGVVTLNSLVDDIHGDLNNQGSCSVPKTIFWGARYVCSFNAQVMGEPSIETDTVTATVEDEEGDVIQVSDSASVHIWDVPGGDVTIAKTAEPSALRTPTDIVTFTIRIENLSFEAARLESLVDDVYGDLNGRGTCSVPQTILGGEMYECSFSTEVAAEAPGVETDTVTATASDNEGNVGQVSDSATVTIFNPTSFIYLALIRRNPLVVVACRRPDRRPTAAIVADSILRRGSDALLVDPQRRAELISEIERVLSLIRSAQPAVAHISARETYEPGRLMASLTPGLRDVVASILSDREGPVVFKTGYEAFDQLNHRLGLRGVGLDRHYVMLCFDEHVNVPAAGEAYTALEEVRRAGPNVIIGDGPHVVALRDGGVWYVVFRDASGDCPAGCIHTKLWFFTVAGDAVTEVERSQALSDAHFQELAARASYGERN